jgi:chitin deacetylase
MFATTLLLSSALALSVFAHPHGEGAHASHAHNVQRQLPTSWFQRDDHHAHALFVRDEADATAAVKAGTPSWVALFPSSTPDSSQMPQAWKDSLAAAVAAKAIPNFPASTVDPVNGPVYVSSVDPNSASSVCSATYKCRLPGDIWDAPAGILGVRHIPPIFLPPPILTPSALHRLVSMTDRWQYVPTSDSPILEAYCFFRAPPTSSTTS